MTGLLVESPVERLTRFRPMIEKALEHGGNTHRFEDLVAGIESGAYQPWYGGDSLILTELVVTPADGTHVHFFLAAGTETGLKVLHDFVIEWAIGLGCTKATTIGRHGWSRSWLTKDLGWIPTLVCMAKRLTKEPL